MFREATTSPTARLILDEIAEAAKVDQCYQALKLTRRIIRHEDAVLTSVPPPSEFGRRPVSQKMAVAAE